MAEMIDYKITNNNRFRYIFMKLEIFSKFTWCIPLKIKYSETTTKDFSSILTKSKRKPKIESDRGGEFYSSVFQNFLKSKNIHHYSRFTEKVPQ